MFVMVCAPIGGGWGGIRPLLVWCKNCSTNSTTFDRTPANLIRRQLDGKIVLIDFGAIKQVKTLVVNNPGLTSIATRIGTPGYMPNEQGNGKPKLSSDIYAVGMVAIQAVTGVYPSQLSEDPNTGEVMWRNQAQVSDRLADILSKMVHSNFSQRYPSADEALQAIATLAVPRSTIPSPAPASANLPVPAPQNIPTNPPKKPRGKIILSWLSEVFLDFEKPWIWQGGVLLHYIIVGLLLAFASKPGFVWATVGAVAGIIIGLVVEKILGAVSGYNNWKKSRNNWKNYSWSDYENKYWSEYWDKHVYVDLAKTVGVAVAITLPIAGISGFARTGATAGAVFGAWVLAISAVAILLRFPYLTIMDLDRSSLESALLRVIALVAIAFILALAVTGILAGIGTKTITWGWAIVRGLAWALAGILPVAGLWLDLYATEKLNVSNYHYFRTLSIFSASSFLGLGLGWLAGSILA